MKMLKMTGNIVHLLFLLVSCTVLKIKCAQQFHVVGVYSMCLENTNKTQMNIDTFLIDNILKREFIPYSLYSWRLKPQDIVYHSFDVCENRTILGEVLQSLTLSENYTFNAGNETHVDSSLLAIFTHMPFEMVRILKAVITDVPILDIGSRVHEEDGTIYDPLLQWATDLERLTKIYKL